MKKLSSVLFENLAKQTIHSFDSKIFDDISSFDDLIRKSNNKSSEEKELHSNFKQEHVLSVEQDNIMQKYFVIADIIDALLLVSKFYSKAKENKISWHDAKIVKHLTSISKYICQLASFISVEHENIQPEINLPPNTFDNNKSLATFIKQSEEWKSLKALLKSDLTLTNQSLTIRGIGFSIISKTKSFIKIIN